MPNKLTYILGLSLLLIGLIILTLTFYPVLTQEISYDLKLNPQYIFSPNATVSAEPEISFEKTLLIPKSEEFSLVIPQIGVNEIVYPNIDSGNPDEYLPILKKGVAHAKNSSFPGLSGPTFIFAHSTDSFWNITRYNASFFLLRKLNPGDDIYIIFKNKQFHYQVTKKQVVNPDEISSIVSSISEQTLILQTCYPPGTTIKRILVYAKPI